jgi:hypothetical protein
MTKTDGMAQHGREQMIELPAVLKYEHAINISFGVMVSTGLMMKPELYGKAIIPDDMEVVIRRNGQCVEVVTRPRVMS